MFILMYVIIIEMGYFNLREDNNEKKKMILRSVKLKVKDTA